MIEEGHQVEKPELLFSKIETAQVDKQIEKLNKSKADNKKNNPKVVEAKQNICFDDFTKLDIRIGTIIEAEKVPKTSKLLKLLVDTGIDQRVVVSGIAEYYNADEIVGKKVSVLVNLEPRKIKGIESQGMVLMAENEDGVLSFISPEKENIHPGDQVR